MQQIMLGLYSVRKGFAANYATKSALNLEITQETCVRLIGLFFIFID